MGSLDPRLVLELCQHFENLSAEFALLVNSKYNLAVEWFAINFVVGGSDCC